MLLLLLLLLHVKPEVLKDIAGSSGCSLSVGLGYYFCVRLTTAHRRVYMDHARRGSRSTFFVFDVLGTYYEY